MDIEAFRFDGLKDLNEIALATGIGLRYDFGFCDSIWYRIQNLQSGTPEGDHWFKEYNFANSVFNIGINYPF